MATKLTLSDDLRRRIETSPLSRAGICRAIGLDQAVLSRFMRGKSGLSLKTVDRLADLLGLHLVGPGRKAKPKH